LVNDDKGALDVCKTVGPDLAVTWNPYSSEAGDRYYPSQITICDWFYQWSRTSDYKVSSLVGQIIATGTDKDHRIGSNSG